MNETRWARFKRSVREVRRETIKVHLVLLSIQLAFSVFYIVAKVALKSMDPFIFLTYRLLLATPILWLFAVITEPQQMRKLPSSPREWLLLVLVGIFAVTINQSLFLEGLELSTASNAAITQPAIPIFSTLLAVAFKYERKSWLKFVGIGVSVAGAILMVDLTHLRDDSRSSLNILFGNLCFLGNTMAYAGFLLLQRPLLALGNPPAKIMSWAFLFGTIPVIALTLGITRDYSDFLETRYVNWLAILYTAIFATAYTFWASSWAVKKSDSTTVAMYLCVEPLVTSIAAAIFLHERLTILNILGAITVLVGVAVVMVAKHREYKKDIMDQYTKDKLLTESTATGADVSGSQDMSINTPGVRGSNNTINIMDTNSGNEDDAAREVEMKAMAKTLGKVVMDNHIYRIVKDPVTGEIEYRLDEDQQNQSTSVMAPSQGSNGRMEEIFEHNINNSVLSVTADQDDDDDDEDDDDDNNDEEHNLGQHRQLKAGNKIFK
ncbi:hypothetical protein SAMD00019534_020080 [Acytostelium subglobosum LB1]|uniref:hypothetical protein n=1 Tax=Acytostelium subglobosum LB1 TaxID=1410327 RepID=UPI0006447F1C|nr:hypothetical protein SAMD00019534_020080 [Acytostelium subglobosum LB1]GAM18833.1 hypothetical protein SAMD00019534_020080 [Acytostelium subglobosum LB1]|eukprot:XP_012758053.1 hypothetical protein SAMD00019534_020080 [Acytostelium subglobosum LB1]